MWCYDVLEQVCCGGVLVQMWCCGVGQQVWCGGLQQVHKCFCNVGLGLSVCTQGWLRSGQKVSGSSCVGLVCNAVEWERVRGNAPQE